MKKIIEVILAAMTISLVGCQSKESDKNDSSEEPVSQSSVEQISQNSTVSSDDVNDLYYFPHYENNEVFNIEKVNQDADTESKCTTYSFTFLSDGYKINGYVSIPSSAIKTQKSCKCILHCRGGNSNYGILEENDTALMCAFSNRIVIACELRGCNGSEGTDQFGGGDLHDVIKLIDLCEKNFTFIDMDDFCVEGESRGGMMTYMTARQDKRVKKIIVCSGIADMFRCYDEREDSRDLFVECIGGTPEEKTEEYKKRSAVYWADEIKIPVLIIHSRLDDRVSFGQAKEMYEKLQGITDCTFITYDDDYHGFHDEDIPKMINWMNTH